MKKAIATQRFPQEIIEEIFLGSPVKTLLKFKCLSKSWNLFICSQTFAELHFKQQSIQQTKAIAADKKILVSTCSYLGFLDYKTPFNDETGTLVRLNFPPKTEEHRVQIVGSCNGLVAILLNYKDLLLWNQSIGDYKELPHPCVPLTGECDLFAIGFGYDSYDYKLLCEIFHPSGASNFWKTTTAIYSLRRNCWREIQTPFGPPELTLHQSNSILSGPIVNGALHWPLLSSRTNLLAFDLKMEIFSRLPTPTPNFSTGILDLGVLDGKLCSTVTKYNLRLHHSYELWVMKEYGVAESWTKLLSLRDINDYCVCLPFCISKANNAFILINEAQKELKYTFDFEVTKLEGLRICCSNCDPQLLRLHDVTVYTESLISPNHIYE